MTVLPVGATLPSAGSRYLLRLGGRSAPTLWVSYEHLLGRVGWTDPFGLVRQTLVSAVIDGVAYER
jgi:hypothetical protein